MTTTIPQILELLLKVKEHHDFETGVPEELKQHVLNLCKKYVNPKKVKKERICYDDNQYKNAIDSGAKICSYCLKKGEHEGKRCSLPIKKRDENDEELLCFIHRPKKNLKEDSICEEVSK